MKATLIFLSTLVIGLGAAFAQVGTEGRFLDRASVSDLRATDLMGATVYVTDMAATTRTVDGPMDTWESVGNVDDFVMSQDGDIRGVLLDIGGFLGIGARTVMVNLDALQIVQDTDSDSVHVVLVATREELENAPEFDQQTLTSEARTDFGGRLGAPETQREGFTAVAPTELTADALASATVYDRFGDRVSGISDVVLSDAGTDVEAVLLDVGGFLGLFTRTVRVDIDQLEIQSDPEQRDLRVYLNMTREELENLPEHETR
jgi:uncharacterized ion transporter superfamily protein YfcC